MPQPNQRPIFCPTHFSNQTQQKKIIFPSEIANIQCTRDIFGSFASEPSISFHFPESNVSSPFTPLESCIPKDIKSQNLEKDSVPGWNFAVL